MTARQFTGKAKSGHALWERIESLKRPGAEATEAGLARGGMSGTAQAATDFARDDLRPHTALCQIPVGGHFWSGDKDELFW